MTAIVRWTGGEVRALRQARRMSVRTFADHLGVSARMVSKWEAAGQAIEPRVVNQAALDTSLATADSTVRARFERLAADAVVPTETLTLITGARLAMRHPIDGKLMTLIEPGPYGPPNGPTQWLPGFFIDVHPTVVEEYGGFVQATNHPRPSSPQGADTPVKVRWSDAAAYATWAARTLPTPTQLHRAATGSEGVLVTDLGAEWCVDRDGAARPTGVPSSRQATFRTVIDTIELLALLGI